MWSVLSSLLIHGYLMMGFTTPPLVGKCCFLFEQVFNMFLQNFISRILYFADLCFRLMFTVIFRDFFFFFYISFLTLAAF